jgi:cytochrome oxidase Cu insertion factor (SCO1/SenC/PrrC family)
MATRVAIALLALACALIAPASATPRQDPRHIPLVDQRGTVFRIADLAGRPVVVTFVATRCSDACPIADAMFSKLQSRLRKEGTKAALLTVTLDPRYDSPFVMARFAREYSADARTWRLASGDPHNVFAMMGAFGVVARPDRNGVPDAHTSFVYVLDTHGRLARTLLLSTNVVDEAAKLLHGRGVG